MAKSKKTAKAKAIARRAKTAPTLPPQEVYSYKGNTFFLIPVVDADHEFETGKVRVEWWADHPGVPVRLEERYDSKDDLKRAIRSAMGGRRNNPGTPGTSDLVGRLKF